MKIRVYWEPQCDFNAPHESSGIMSHILPQYNKSPSFTTHLQTRTLFTDWSYHLSMPVTVDYTKTGTISLSLFFFFFLQCKTDVIGRWKFNLTFEWQPIPMAVMKWWLTWSLWPFKLWIAFKMLFCIFCTIFKAARSAFKIGWASTPQIISDQASTADKQIDR